MNDRPKGEERPQPKTFEELVVPVLDGSGSMAGPEKRTGQTKAASVTAHLFTDENGLIPRLKVSGNRNRLSLAIVTYDHRVDVTPAKPLMQVEDADLHVDLLKKHGGATAIGRALSAAAQEAERWVAQADPRVPRFATILLMSDGAETSGSDPLGVASRIKGAQQNLDGRPQIVIASSAYGEGDEATLRAVASQRADGSPFFARVQSGQELRDFFMGSIRSSVI